MALDRIENLLEKYFEAQTSISEEKELKDYFASADVAPTLEQYKPIFGYVFQAKQEQFNIAISLQPRFPEKVSLKNIKRNNVVWLSVAASVVVLLGIGLFTFNNYIPSKSGDLGSYDDPQVAFRETQKALTMISESVNKGITSMNYLNEYEQSKNRIFKK